MEIILSVLETTQNYLFLYYQVLLLLTLNLLEGSVNNTLNIDAAGLIGGNPHSVSPPNTTNYTLTSVTDVNGCTQTLNESKTLIVNELPVVDVSGTTEICNEEITQIYFDFKGFISMDIIL